MTLGFGTLKHKEGRPNNQQLDDQCGRLRVHEHICSRSVNVASVDGSRRGKDHTAVVLDVLHDELNQAVGEEESTFEPGDEVDQLILVGLVNHQEIQEEEEYTHSKEGDQLEEQDQPVHAVTEFHPDILIV